MPFILAQRAPMSAKKIASRTGVAVGTLALAVLCMRPTPLAAQSEVPEARQAVVVAANVPFNDRVTSNGISSRCWSRISVGSRYFM